MILPIGHGESSTRRLPWVTFAVMAVCLVAFLATDTSGLEPSYDPDQLMEDAAQYWRDHAYLTADPEIRTRVGYDVMPNQRTQYLALMEDQALATPPREPAEWEAEQAELDQLTDYAMGRAVPPHVENSDSPFRKWGLLPSSIGLIALLSHIFMHAGWLHLLSNMFMFFLAGPPVEDRLGRPTFLAFFVSAGVFAGLFWSALASDPNIPLVGASGAISGVLGAFLIRFWNSDIRFGYFFMFGFRPYFGTFEAKAWLMLPLWFANELFQAWLADQLGVRGGVAYWAHVGGFVFGAASVGVFRVLGIEEKFIDRRIEEKVTVAEANPIVQDALAAREQGDHTGALATLEAAFAETPNDRDVALALWDAAQAVDEPSRGAVAMAALVRLCVADGDRSMAIHHWMDLTRTLPTALADPNALIKLVPDLLADGDTELAVRALRQAVDPENSGMTAGMARRAMEVAREIDPPSALRAGRLALASPDLHEAKREQIGREIDELVAGGVEEAPTVAEAEASLQADRGRREIELPEEEVEQPIPVPPVVVAPPPGPSPGAQRPAPPPVPPPLADAGAPLALDPSGSMVTDEAPLAPPPLPDAIAATPPPLPAAPVAPEPPAQPPHLDDDSIDDDEISFGVLDSVGEAVRFADAKIVEGALTALEDGVLRFDVDGTRKAKVDYERIEAIGVGAVRGLGPKPILLVDLVLNWTSLDANQVQVVRLRSNAFDPRRLVEGETDALSALRKIVAQVLELSGAVPLPDPEAAAGLPFRVFDDLASYQREVLQVG